MDKETELLSRLAANHLHLAQFEPLRATLLSLRAKNPRHDCRQLGSVRQHCLVTFLPISVSSSVSFDPRTLAIQRSYFHMELRSRYVAATSGICVIEKEKECVSEGFEEDKPEILDRSEDLKEGSDELGDCIRVLDMFLELGMMRLRPDVVMEGVDGDGAKESKVVPEKVLIEENEMGCLRKVIMDYADAFDALCGNIQRQLKGLEVIYLGMAIMVRREEKVRLDACDEEHKTVLGSIQKSVQLAHLDAIKDCMKHDDIEGVVSRIRFLHLDYGVDEVEYRVELKKVLGVQ
ncbi:hypothetical protein CCACVL1_23237 [Corchorus capsularis]|uniref:Uncharacterized protein n=1 Tax=Corchorus capsularis TaxID=210143 RepID=A0A1R3GUX0_COCAP|nr:hypothetical protein CCACVL1_23237 [Corchorus capsularis]